jgi:hypothetical protein
MFRGLLPLAVLIIGPVALVALFTVHAVFWLVGALLLLAIIKARY